MADNAPPESDKVESFTETRIETAKTDSAVIFSALSDLMVMIAETNVAVRTLIHATDLPPHIQSSLDGTARGVSERLGSMIEALDKWRGRNG